MNAQKEIKAWDTTLDSGYPKTPRKVLIEEILVDAQIQQIIKRVAKKNNRPVFLVERRARKILKEMAADITPTSIRRAYSFFSFLWKKLYTRLYVDLEGLEKARPVLNGNPVILVPSHKSHLDYLLLSSIFHENHITPPFIAAGANLSFWPFGYIFRKIGAFFIRRSIGRDILYFKLLSKYMSMLIKVKAKQEFFIEGGRSRNGKIQSPKLGLLTLQIDAFLEQEAEDLYFLPIAITYDRILEENAYCDEIIGGKKVKESLLEVVKSVKVLKSTYGSAFIKFGTPISLKEYLNKTESQRLNPKLKKKLIKDLASTIVKNINSMGHVTQTSLLSLALLSNTKGKISHEELIRSSKSYLSYLLEIKTGISNTLEAGEKSILTGINFLTAANLMGAFTKNGTRFYKVKKRNRIILDYYKNNIMHFCLPLLFVAASIRKMRGDKIPLNKISEDFDFLSNLLVNEFYIGNLNQSDLEKAIDWLAREKIIASSGSGKGEERLIEIIDPSLVEIFSNGLRNHLEAYLVTVIGMQKIICGNAKIVEGNLTDAIIKIGLRLFKKDKILIRESVLTPYINNAIKYLNRNIVSSVKNVLPAGDLEEEDDLDTREVIANLESQEIDRLILLKNKIRKFLN